MNKPRYEKFVDILAKAIQDGTLPPGSKLPTHRSFADTSGVALATATRVYKELKKRGLVVGEAGRGTFVRDQTLPLTLGAHQSALNGVTDLVFNIPSTNDDAAMLRTGLKRLASTGDLDAMLRYQPHAGRQHERQIIADYLRSQIGEVPPDRLLLTSGAQHGLSIACLGLFDHGDKIAVDALTYPGFKSAAALRGLELVPISGSAGVMDPDDLERQCQLQRIRAVYLMPTVHSPLGSVMDEETRRAIIAVADQNELLILEDSAYAVLEDSPPPSLLSMNPKRVVHIGGFSKNLSTGLRLGYVIAPEHHQTALVEIIRATTWNTPALITGLVTGWVQDGTLEKAQTARRRDGAERQAMCREVFSGSTVISHQNASFAWLPLPNGQREEPIISRLSDQGIAVSGAKPFATTPSAPQAIRLAFGGLPKQSLKEKLEKVREAISAS